MAGKGRGRPSSYREEFCEIVEEMGREGKSVAQMAARLNVSKDTIYEWVKAHADFADSFTRARTFSQAWWEAKGQESIGDRNFNANLYKISMSARFRDDYTERKEITGADGGAVKIESNIVDSRELDADQRAALRKILLAAKAKGTNDG